MFLEKRIVCTRRDALLGDTGSRVILAEGASRRLAWASGRAARAYEALHILGIDAPDRPDLDAVEPPAGEQAAHVGGRSVQRGRGFDDGEWARTWNGVIILARRRNNLFRDLLWWEGSRTEARAFKA
jgi:hypothetical protein